MTPQQIDTMKLALGALTYIYTETTADEDELIDQAITAIKEALAQPEQEPDELNIAYMSGLYDGKKKRPWVDLTYEERNALLYLTVTHGPIDYAIAIENKLKEKQNEQ